MGNYENIFEKVGKAKVLNSWEPALPKGRHKLALVKYGGKESKKDQSVFLEAEFIVLESNNPAVKPGARHSWPWFVNKPDEFGYTHARAKNFLEVLQKCIGNEADATRFGNDLAEDFATAAPEAYGLMVEAQVDLVTTPNGQPRLGKKGQEIANVTWIAVPQAVEDIVEVRGLLEQLAPKPATPAKIATAVEPPTAPKAPRMGGLSTLLGRR